MCAAEFKRKQYLVWLWVSVPYSLRTVLLIHVNLSTFTRNTQDFYINLSMSQPKCKYQIGVLYNISVLYNINDFFHQKDETV